MIVENNWGSRETDRAFNVKYISVMGNPSFFAIFLFYFYLYENFIELNLSDLDTLKRSFSCGIFYK